MGRLNETQILYDIETIQQGYNPSISRLHVLSESTLQLALSSIRYAEWGSRTIGNDADAHFGIVGGTALDWHRRAVDELVTGVDMDDLLLTLRHINANLGKLVDDTSQPLPEVADYSNEGLGWYVSSIDSKTPELVGLPDIIAALTTSGTLQELEAMLNIIDAIPGLDIQLSVTDMIGFFFDAYYKSRILAAENTQATAQTYLAKAYTVDELTDEFNQWITTLMDTLDIAWMLNDGYQSWFSNLLKLLNIFTGDDPPTEPRAITKVMNEVFVEGDKLTLKVIQECCTGGLDGSESPDSDDAAEGDPVPEGHIEPDTGITDRKCKAANLIVDDVLLFLQTFGTDIWTLSDNLQRFLATLALLGAAAPFYLLWRVYNSTPGKMLEIATYAISLGLAGRDDLITKITDNKQSLICDLFNATSASSARSDFLNNSDASFTLLQQDLLGSLMPSKVMNLLFFGLDDSELVLDGYAPPLSCDACDPCNANPVYVIFGTWDGVDTLTSERFSDATYNKEVAVVRFQADVDGNRCGEVTINNVTVTGGPIHPSGAATNAWRLKRADGTTFYDSDNEPSWPQYNVAELNVRSTKAKPYNTEEYSLQIDWTV